MNSRTNAAALFIAIAWVGLPADESEACDRCQHAQTQQCSCRDDRGLLHLLDSMAGRVQAKVQKISWNSPLKKSKPSCDCCGAPKTSAPACGCEQRGQTYRSKPAGNQYAPPAPPQQYAPIRPAYPNDVPVVPVPQVQPEPPRQLRPLPPLPDSQVDPFRDEEASRIRRLPPTRKVQYQKSLQSYGSQYDKQARVTPSPIRMNLGDNSSRNRRLAVRPQTSGAPSVVAASGTTSVGLQRVTERTHLRSVSDEREQYGEYYNPLRR